MSDPKSALPPGSSGLPLLGETLPFLKDMFGFIAARVAKHGDVFRTSVLGQKTAFIAGPEACEKWLETDTLVREGSFPKNVQELFGGRSLPLLDGEEHLTRKRLVLAAFTPQALVAYLPVLQSTVERAFESWVGKEEVPWLDEMKKLAIEGISATMLGMKPGPEMDELLADYRVLMLGLTGLPVPLPGTAYTNGLKARDRILTFLEKKIVEHQNGTFDDGLSRLLAARENGVALTVEHLKLELHHFVIAGLIVFAEFGATVIALTDSPKVRARLEKEILSVSPSGPIAARDLAKMPYLLQTMMEVKRWCPNVPISFGRSAKPMQVGDYTIPEGWLVFMAVGANNMHKQSFTNPDKFDPDRFGPDRAEDKKHPHAYVPQGPGSNEGHKCAGADFSTVFMQAFTIVLLRSHTWELPPQDLFLKRDVVPPEPKDGLRAKVMKKS